MPIFNPVEEEEFYRGLYGQVQQSKADLPTQLVRGFTSGLTFGAVKPYKEELVGGIPETLANLAGALVGFVPVVRGAGLGITAAGKIFPSLLARTGSGAARLGVGEAAQKILSPTFYPYPKALSSGGRMAMFGAATGGGALAEGLLSDEPQSSADLLTSAAIGAGLGIGGEILGQAISKRKAVSRALSDIGVGSPSGPPNPLNPEMSLLQKLQVERDKLKGKFNAAVAKYGILESMGKADTKAGKSLKREMDKLGEGVAHIEGEIVKNGGVAEARTLGSAIRPPAIRIIDQTIDPFTGTTLEGQASRGLMRAPEPDIDPFTGQPLQYLVPTEFTGSVPKILGRPLLPDDIRVMPMDVVRTKLRAMGHTLADEPDHRLREMLAKAERDLGLAKEAPLGRTLSTIPEVPSVQARATLEEEVAKTIKTMSQKELVDYLVSSGRPLQRLEQLTLEQMRGLVAMDRLKDVPSSGMSGGLSELTSDLVKSGMTPARQSLLFTYKTAPSKLDREKLEAGQIMLRQGKYSRLPEDVRRQIDVIDRNPFGDVNSMCILTRSRVWGQSFP